MVSIHCGLNSFDDLARNVGDKLSGEQHPLSISLVGHARKVSMRRVNSAVRSAVSAEWPSRKSWSIGFAAAKTSPRCRARSRYRDSRQLPAQTHVAILKAGQKIDQADIQVLDWAPVLLHSVRSRPLSAAAGVRRARTAISGRDSRACLPTCGCVPRSVPAPGAPFALPLCGTARRAEQRSTSGRSRSAWDKVK